MYYDVGCILSLVVSLLFITFYFNSKVEHPCQWSSSAESKCLGEISMLSQEGPFAEVPQCRLSILRNGHVPCHYFYNFHADSKMAPCRMSIETPVSCHYMFCGHVDKPYVACRF